MTYAAPATPLIGNAAPFEFTPLPFGSDAAPDAPGRGPARLRNGSSMPQVGPPKGSEFPPEPLGGAPAGTELRLPDPSGDGRRRTRGLDPGYEGALPASYQSTSY